MEEETNPQGCQDTGSLLAGCFKKPPLQLLSHMQGYHATSGKSEALKVVWTNDR